MHKGREEWQEDVSARQRNVVFPEAVQNEGRFWRNLTSGKQKLPIVQVIGIALFLLTAIGLLWSDAAWKFRFEASGSIFDRLVPVLADWAIVLVIFAVSFFLLRWRVRRAFSGKRPDRPH
jgi:hypothetical protein